ncbi:hypothetical protein FNB15_20775 [Ferrovibrio terrae]|uniref:Uncharacterized protein n=1 Tax=Ferrovibrio terrae TaxID=2594003 RepID=A0A516H706_9PROT|nr:hypothetical protein [Ferrovibrio terrae]QDO99547.1 hypothetical protein FNB15_20775 [Ferrovibrio terrae]
MSHPDHPTRLQSPPDTDTPARTRGLIDRDSFLKLEPGAQETLLRQTLLLYLTALELAGLNASDWESAAFTAAVDHLAARAPLHAYHEIERMLTPPDRRPATRNTAGLTAILRVETSEASALPQRLDRNGMRRRLLQLSAIQLPIDMADARRSVIARSRRKLQPAMAQSEGDEAGD